MGEQPQPYEPKRRQSWTAYLYWRDLYKSKQRWANRLNSIERGASYIDPALTISALATFESALEDAQKELITVGRAEFGPVFEWATSIKGIGDWLAIKLLAQLDDIERFPSISSLWSYSGLNCVDGAAAPRNGAYNRIIKATMLGPLGYADQVKRHKPYPYHDIFVEYIERKRREHSEPVCSECGSTSPEEKHRKSACCSAKINWTDFHIKNMAFRIVAKELLKHLWIVWRTVEGLPISKPHAQDEVIPPPNFVWNS